MPDDQGSCGRAGAGAGATVTVEGMAGRKETERAFYIGVDGGGTKTLAVVTDGEFRVLAEGRSGPSNFLRVGLEAAVAAVDEAVSLALVEAGVAPEEVPVSGIGLAGVDHPSLRAKMFHALKRALTVPAILLVGDARAAAAGATNLQPGIVIIAGTGSIAYGVNAEGRTARSGGWGPVMGDEGSGYDIARHALAAVANAVDGRSAPTSLTVAVCHHFGVAAPEDLPAVVYDPTRTSQSDIAKVAEIVVREAKAGDGVALAILDNAGRDLGRAVVAVVRKLSLERESFQVAYVGGVFGAGALILDPLRETVLEVAPRASFILPIFGPAVGAAKLAAAWLESTQRRSIAS